MRMKQLHYEITVNKIIHFLIVMQSYLSQNIQNITYSSIFTEHLCYCF